MSLFYLELNPAAKVKERKTTVSAAIAGKVLPQRNCKRPGPFPARRRERAPSARFTPRAPDHPDGCGASRQIDGWAMKALEIGSSIKLDLRPGAFNSGRCGRQGTRRACRTGMDLERIRSRDSGHCGPPQNRGLLAAAGTGRSRANQRRSSIVNTDLDMSGNIGPLSASELDAVAGGWYSSGVYKCADGKDMWVGNFSLPGGGMIVTSWKDDGKGVSTEVIN
jgi:hypothetical protein